MAIAGRAIGSTLGRIHGTYEVAQLCRSPRISTLAFIVVQHPSVPLQCAHRAGRHDTSYGVPPDPPAQFPIRHQPAFLAATNDLRRPGARQGKLRLYSEEARRSRGDSRFHPREGCATVRTPSARPLRPPDAYASRETTLERTVSEDARMGCTECGVRLAFG